MWFLFCATNSRGKIGPILDKYSTLLLVKVHTHTYHSKGFTSWHYCGFVNWQGTLMGWNRKLIWGNNQYLHFDLLQEDLSISWSFAIKYLKVFVRFFWQAFVMFMCCYCVILLQFLIWTSHSGLKTEIFYPVAITLFWRYLFSSFEWIYTDPPPPNLSFWENLFFYFSNRLWRISALVGPEPKQKINLYCLLLLQVLFFIKNIIFPPIWKTFFKIK